MVSRDCIVCYGYHCKDMSHSGMCLTDYARNCDMFIILDACMVSEYVLYTPHVIVCVILRLARFRFAAVVIDATL